ncbi:MAG: mannose-1-phosphate guanylyltransferase/mannose-6-phosphate isomerase [Rhizobiaceae bacterium]|nr:mannose-1-phosphate guanylyltransferase/mannose-6-phosphate isomerase [Rhizobiaceae bacterium]MCV0408141.1 mannose-1-phosphate guanylyltransferase/mannose-6-phosphate isomerase [Rhizobiaceae bacterium]
MFVPVIMAGGSGTRLWPLSRQLYPKQFHALTGGLSLLQETVARLEGLDAAHPLPICNEEHRFIVAEQLREIGHGEAAILLEPVGRNTAPAIALAALHATRLGDDPLLLVLAADHAIGNVAAFRAAVETASLIARDGYLVTFGIVPDRPETGFGYIERGAPLQHGGHAVASFAEKPDGPTAEAYLAGGKHFWNSGMFMFRAGRYLKELERHRPDIARACRAAMAETRPDLQFVRVDEEAFRACPSDSIDYAVMEKTDRAAMVPLDAGWNDVGSWSALRDIMPRDDNGNVLIGDVVALSSRDNLVHGDDRLVALLGVSDLVVVDTKDALLVAHRDAVQQVKDVVDLIRSQGRTEHVSHRKVYRPWGSYDSVDFGDRYQVKRITVSPGAKLSLQMHHHRAEHWVVVRGTARVYRGDEVIMLSENQSTYIPLGEVHALENPGKIALELIEVQSGSYLGEDDIVRLEDRYGRS